jgi:benzoyl-CoA reductase/2-hydroxyglutaryl-CoA dehydratase subunit BcrC/BadD/HgdB
LRLGFVGVPPIVPDIYACVESAGGLVVYNETQRQFAMPEEADSLAEQYSRYTYPYGIFARVEDVKRECERRALDGIIHYVQSFCFRRIEDRILRASVPVPVLTVECDLPGALSGQLATRLEAFVQMLEARKAGRAIF